MPDISSYPRVARFVNGPDESQSKDLHIRSEHGTFSTHAEAETEARKVADKVDKDAIIIQDEGGFHVYGVDEINALLPGGSFSGEVVREAPIVSFVATDPLSGAENIIGQRSTPDPAAGPSAPGSETPTAQAAQQGPPTALDRYAQKYDKDLSKVLGSAKADTIQDLNQRIRALEGAGIKITIEMDDDVFESKDKLAGFKNLLDYAVANVDVLKQRSIREIAVMDEWDGVFGTKVDLEYDKKEGVRKLEIGDDFLSDWGESLETDHAKSVGKLSKELGTTLKPAEVEKRTEIFQNIRSSLSKSFDAVNNLQQASIQGKPAERGPVISELRQTIDRLEKEVIPDAEKTFGDFSIKQERQLSEKYLETFKDTLKGLRSQLDDLDKLDTAGQLKPDQRKPANAQLADLEFNARLEKIKLVLIKGVKEIPDTNRNYLGTYVGGLGTGTSPSAGLEYARSFGRDRETVASVRAGTSAPLTSKGGNNSDIMLGLGVNHTFHSRNKILDGANAGIGVGFSRQTPFFVGVSAGNSWYLNDYHGLKGEWSAVGSVNATVGTYNNVGASLSVHKQFGDKVEFEGYGELSLWNQAAEVEGEFAAFGKDKNVYLTAGVGTNKLVYAGVGFADKYELEVGLGGVSFGKDSNNLPGESSWEAGLRILPLPLPYFRHQRVPGYQFSYGDKSTEYITPNGTFMTIKEDDKGNKVREAYVPDAKASSNPNQIVYRQVRSKEQLDKLDEAPKREITLGPLGYLTVVENGETIVEDGLIKKQLTEAELGIITDQAGVLWYDRMNPESTHQSLGTRRQDMPLPLYRAVHY